MNSVEKIKAICKERKIPISRLEKDLGFGNGYIGQLKKGTMPYERLVQVANYLNVSSAFLTDENENKPILMDELEMGNVSDIKMKMIGLIQNMPDDVLIKWYELLEAQAAQYKK